MNQCKSGKVSYPDRKAAETAMNWIMSNKRDKKLKLKRVYKCPTCKNYHLTSDKKEKGMKPGNLLLPNKFKELLKKQKDGTG